MFVNCVNQWCLQKGLQKPQHTKCESATNNGKTCNNPEIKYGTATGGFPRKNSHNKYEKWCQQLGGAYESHTTGTRSGYALWGHTGTGCDDTENWHWNSWDHTCWYNKPQLTTTHKTFDDFTLPASLV